MPDRSPPVTARPSAAVERILDAADACFAHYGIAKTTMEDVASAAEISRATLYRTFSDRESLLTALVRRRARMNIERSRARIMALGSLTERVVEGITLNVRVGHRDPLMHALVSPEQMALANTLLSSTGLATELTHEFWEPVLAAARDTGEIRADLDLVGLCEWISRLEIMFIVQLEDTPEDTDRIRRLVADFVVPALTAAR
ncbi:MULTISPECIES: TetR/AcrR family transcriptional regulator [unclassified Pseudonocardia]|uniref:TetR/AcrR family transcriptional regulator n=1 Tax=unclassified Pseudonocardia TaxID=2619320 RepID=UPI00193101D9|nr:MULTISPECIES: TetR/AcrR family transcriptional regulator [unclassified Pseudonocardia]